MQYSKYWLKLFKNIFNGSLFFFKFWNLLNHKNWTNFLWWLFYGCFEGIGVEGCMIPLEGRFSSCEWDWAPVVDYAFIPPSPLLNFFVRVAVYFEPKIFLKIKYISYFLFMLWIPICLHAQPSIDAALIFSLVLFVYVCFFKCYNSIKEFG